MGVGFAPLPGNRIHYMHQKYPDSVCMAAPHTNRCVSGHEPSFLLLSALSWTVHMGWIICFDGSIIPRLTIWDGQTV
jgi:hypothetical protein